MKKHKIWLVLALLVGLALLAALGCSSPSTIASPTSTLGGSSPGGALPPSVEKTAGLVLVAGGASQQVGLWVTGQGKVTAEPDLAILTLGIEAQATSVAQAQALAAEAMDKVYQALAANGVAPKDIKTTYFSIYPVRRWVQASGEEVLVGYRVANTVTAKIWELKKVGATIDAVAAAGGDLTRIQGISFGIDDPTPYYTQAREEAMKDALAKAKQMATLVGVTLGKPTYISESGGYTPGRELYMEKAAAGAPAVTTPISAGELEISLSVQVVFAIQ